VSLQFSSLLLILLAGALPSVLVTRRRIHLAGANPWQQTLEALLFGVAFTLFGALLNELSPRLAALSQAAAEALQRFAQEPDKVKVPPAIPCALVLSLLNAAGQELRDISRWVRMREFFSVEKRRRARQMIAAVAGGPLQEMLTEAMLSGQPLMLTLSWNKVYAANVLKLPVFGASTAPNATLRLLPLLSGYRDKDTRELSFTEDYSAALLAAAGDEQGQEALRELFEICVRLSDIVAATWWAPDLYETFQSLKQEPQAEDAAPDPRRSPDG
jgi:hypothetical protein